MSRRAFAAPPSRSSCAAPRRACPPKLVLALLVVVATAGAASAQDPGKTPANPAAAEKVAVPLAVPALKEVAQRPAAAEACARENPGHAQCQWLLGWARWMDGRWEEALAAWLTVRHVEPSFPGIDHHVEEARTQAAVRQALAPPAPRVESVRIRAVGDVMLGTTVPEGHLPPEDGATLLADVAATLRDADVTFVNLEGPLCDGGETKKCKSPKNCYAFRTPTRYGEYLRDAGVDLASTANNHSGDFGEPCRRETEATLDRLGIAWSGPPGSIARLTRGDLSIALVAFHTSAACNWLNDHVAAAALVRQARAGSDLVLVSFHGGAEGKTAARVPQGREKFFREDRGDLRAFARAVIDAGAHVVIGHGPHLVRGLEQYQGRLIAYSLGNFATYGRFDLSGPLALGAILEVELARDGTTLRARLIPTHQEGRGIPRLDPQGRVIEWVNRLTRLDFPDTGVQVGPDGALQLPASGSAAR